MGLAECSNVLLSDESLFSYNLTIGGLSSKENVALGITLHICTKVSDMAELGSGPVCLSMDAQTCTLSGMEHCRLSDTGMRSSDLLWSLIPQIRG
ncbi:hypothetical protein AVEN_76245-1 [Araneus ventricosus]|uniref:Uncharacterized protein n=1 Tax=Araneus ventricosus TaxID=182803 RepID=A0A4Y2GNH7_ARAVE|nr:hypothetical protein AVEN_76245-1 [Araneus ventricosus]